MADCSSSLPYVRGRKGEGQGELCPLNNPILPPFWCLRGHRKYQLKPLKTLYLLVSPYSFQSTLPQNCTKCLFLPVLDQFRATSWWAGSMAISHLYSSAGPSLHTMFFPDLPSMLPTIYQKKKSYSSSNSSSGIVLCMSTYLTPAASPCHQSFLPVGVYTQHTCPTSHWSIHHVSKGPVPLKELKKILPN